MGRLLRLWPTFKRWLAVVILKMAQAAVGGQPRRPPPVQLGSAMETAEYCRIRPHYPFVVAMACRSRRAGCVVLGMEPWLMYLPFVRTSAADHEIAHVLQVINSDACRRDWERGHSPWWRLALYELHASVFGSPLIFFSFVSVIAWPFV